jgi:hypothetical protein
MKIKKIALTTTAFVFTGLIAFAQMGGMGGQHQNPASGGMSGSQQSQQMMTGQMMGMDMMRQMSTTMHQMNNLMQQMSHTMQNRDMTDPAHMQDMSKIMGEMSVTMNELAGQMANGKMEPVDIQNLQGRMKNMSQRMQKLETLAKEK